jgi:lipoprotein-releasing system permease protein
VGYELWVGLRYLRSKRKNRLISVGSWISALGVMLGVATLICVVGVMTGFQKSLQAKILSGQAHVLIQQFQGSIKDYRGVLSKVGRIEGVVSAAPYIVNHVLLRAGQSVTGIVLRGVNPALERKVTDFSLKMTRGRFEDLKRTFPGPNQTRQPAIILGADLARSLGVSPGSEVLVISPLGRVTPAGLIPRARKFRVAGVFRSGYYLYDNGLALISLAQAQAFFEMGDAASAVEVKVSDVYKAREVADAIREKLGFPYWTRDWMQMHTSLFAALKMEKTVMFIILVLITLVATFSIVATLVMVVKEKARDIAILKSMGATDGGVLKIFMVDGMTVGAVGTLLGMAGGIALALKLPDIADFLENQFGLEIFQGSVYLIDRLPVDVQGADVALIVAIAFGLCSLATLYPSWKASRVDPAETLRYE